MAQAEPTGFRAEKSGGDAGGPHPHFSYNLYNSYNNYNTYNLPNSLESIKSCFLGFWDGGFYPIL